MKVSRKKALQIISVLKVLKFNDARLDWFVSRNLKKFQPIAEETEEKKYELQLNHASVDKDGNVIRESEKGFLKFTPEKEIQLNKSVKELLAEEVAIEPYVLHPELIAHESIKAIPTEVALLFEDILIPVAQQP